VPARRLLAASFVAVSFAVIVMGASACSSSSDPHLTGPHLTGLGATLTTWKADHGADYSDVVTDPAGHVDSFIVTMKAQSLTSARAQIKRDLPADATAGPARRSVGIEGTQCEIVDFTSPTLGKVFGGDGGDRVLAVFAAQNPNLMDTTQIVHAVVVSGSKHLPEEC
jgi:hypothetical protein